MRVVGTVQLGSLDRSASRAGLVMCSVAPSRKIVLIIGSLDTVHSMLAARREERGYRSMRQPPKSKSYEDQEYLASIDFVLQEVL